jgi:hypothetical protein
MLEKLRHLLGEPPEPPEGTHYVLFLVDDVAYTTNDLPQELAEQVAKGLGGIVMPVEMKGKEDYGS